MNSDAVRQATMVLFGGTGDLTTRKLLPALFDLWRRGRVTDSMILGIGRRFSTREQYLNHLKETVEPAKADAQKWDEFAQSIEYHCGDVQSRAGFESVRDAVLSFEKARNLPGQRLFYYAVDPEWFAPITEHLAAVGLLGRQNRES